VALNIKIDFNDCYETESLTGDLRLVNFETELIDGSKVLMQISISEQEVDLLPNVHNIAFGPLDGNNEIDDHAKLTHMNYSKMFSTIMTNALMFLNKNPNKLLGFDGSNNARAYLYFRIIQNNYEVLREKFDSYGVKLYVRMLRNSDDPIDTEDMKTVSVKISKGERIIPRKMYNYFVFKLKDSEVILNPLKDNAIK
jgi:hypothetical protein